MRLRYLHLAHYPPLADLAVNFSIRAPWAAFEAQGKSSSCSIHFVVGLNGSGKSLLLRSVAASFLALADERLLGFPVTLVYELGTPGTGTQKTVVFDSPGEKRAASLWVAEGWRFPDSKEDDDTFGLATKLLRTVGALESSLVAPFSRRVSRVGRIRKRLRTRCRVPYWLTPLDPSHHGGPSGSPRPAVTVWISSRRTKVTTVAANVRAAGPGKTKSGRPSASA